MYPIDLDAIYWEVIEFRDIISNIKNIYFQPGPLPPNFMEFNTTDTKKPKGPINNEHIEQPSIKRPEK